MRSSRDVNSTHTTAHVSVCLSVRLRMHACIPGSGGAVYFHCVGGAKQSIAQVCGTVLLLHCLLGATRAACRSSGRPAASRDRGLAQWPSHELHPPRTPPPGQADATRYFRHVVTTPEGPCVVMRGENFERRSNDAAKVHMPRCPGIHVVRHAGVCIIPARLARCNAAVLRMVLEDLLHPSRWPRAMTGRTTETSGLPGLEHTRAA